MEEKKFKQLKPYHGIILFVLEIVASFTLFTYLQRKFLMYGVLATELCILFMALGATFLLKADRKQVFPIKMPKVSQVFGSILLWIASYPAVLFSTEVIMYFAPEGFQNVSVGLSRIFRTVPFGLAFVIVAISPAICEELFHRGFVQASMKCIKNKWLIVLIVGAIFGIFHLDRYRFLATAMIGMVLCYVVLETDNIVCSMIIHFLNNALSITTTFLAGDKVTSEAVTQATVMTPFTLGCSLMFCAISPFMLLFGSKLLHFGEKNNGEVSAKPYFIATAISVTIAIVAFAMIMCNLDSMPMNINKF